MNGKKWTLGCLAAVLAMALILGTIVFVVDPFFHYHAPLAGAAYPLNNERYQNDGIVKHFSYDAVITGTSMTENFKTSEFDMLFDAHSVKVPFSGGSFKEINDNLARAFEANDGIRYVVRSLDLYRMAVDKDEMDYEDYPDYLYDGVWWNDVNYLLNKTVVLNALEVLKNTLTHKAGTSFDEYANWAGSYAFGREAILETFQRPEKTAGQGPLGDRETALLEGNLAQNVTELAASHPETEFYLFFPPYSILWWDTVDREGTLERQLDAYERAAEILLEYDNIRVFSFYDDFSLITDLDNYKDRTHYSEEVSSMILRSMQAGEHELTRDNYRERCGRERDFYMSYDYDGLFAQAAERGE